MGKTMFANVRGAAFRLLGLATAVLVVLAIGPVFAAHAADGASFIEPSNNALKEVGKSVTVKARATYTRPSGFSILSFPDNYIYLRVVKDDVQVGDLLKKDFSTVPGFPYEVTLPAFTPETEGKYVLEVHHDYTYDENKNYIELDPDHFKADDSRTIIVQRDISGAEITGIVDKTYTGSAVVQNPVVTVAGKTLDSQTDYDVSYSANTVDVGVVTVTVTGKGFYKGKVTTTFNITPADISKATMGGVVDKTYTGSAIAQTPSVTWNGRLLVAGTDYDLSHENNTNAGTATIQATGKGNFAQTLAKTFKINQASIRDAGEPNIVNKTYTGSAQTQNLNLRFGGRALVEGTDYTAAYSNNTNPGTATITIAGKGNFKDTLTRTFSIIEQAAASVGDTTIMEPADNSQIATTGNITVKVKANKYENAVYNGHVLEGQGYFNCIYVRVFKDGRKYSLSRKQYTAANAELQFAIPKNDDGTFEAGVYEIQSCWTTWTYTVESSGGGVALSFTPLAFEELAPSDSIKVYVGVPVPSDGKNIASASVSGFKDVMGYTGNSVTQSPTVKLGGKTLVNGTDYYITYKSQTYPNPANNVDVGLVEMTIHGKGEYTGAWSKTFIIDLKQITADMITLTPASLTYTGQLQKPQVTVKNGSITLKEGTDYSLANAGGTEPGDYEVTVTGKGNYKPMPTTKTYKINKWSIKNAVVSCDPRTYIYDGSMKEPTVSAMLDGVVLPPETYNVTYSKNTNAGEATATITAKADGYYTGSASTTFTIEPLSIKSEGIVVTQMDNLTYNRKAQAPLPEVLRGKTALVNNTDFTLSYENNTNVGLATVTITGKGNYKNSRSVTFKIVEKDINDASVTVDPIPCQRFVEGEPSTPPVVVKDGNVSLTSEEISVEYADNDKVGTATVTLKGKGNYKGTRDGIEFQILEQTAYAQAVLSDKIAEVAGENLGQFLDADQAAIQAALAAAQALLSDETATVEQLEQAVESIDTAVAAAEVNLAKKKLADAIGAVEAQGTSQYLDADKKVLNAALAAAKALLADENATVAQLEQALSTVKKAATTAKTNLKKAQEQAAKAKAAAELAAAKKEAQKMPSAASVAKSILAQKTDKDPSGSTFAPLKLKSVKQAKKYNVLKWSKVAGASKYVVYGSKCGKKNKIKRIATVKATLYKHKKLKKGTYYKYVVVAVKNTVIGERAAAVSKMIHVATKGGKVGNSKKLAIKAKVGKKTKKISKASIKKGKSLKLKAVLTPASKKLKVKKHVVVRYESSNKSIATVSSKGKVKAKAKGSCTVYVYAQNGVCKSLKVTVK